MVRDVRYAIRALARSPAFAVSATLAIALAIGVNTAVFGVVHDVPLRPLPYADGERLVRIWETNASAGVERGNVSPTSLVEWHHRSATLEQVAVYYAREWLVAFGDDLEPLQGAFVSPRLFDVLGVHPVLGRPFRPEGARADDADAAGEVLISHDLWQRGFGGQADAIGKALFVGERDVRQRDRRERAQRSMAERRREDEGRTHGR
jgi:putative ABC transport system permease protein